jgi:hypothetical protein
MIRFPDEELSVAVLCNHFTWDTRAHALAVADCFLDDRMPAHAAEVEASPPDEGGVLPAGSDRFCGTYFDATHAGVRVVDITAGRLRFEGYDLTPIAADEFVIDVEPTVRVCFITETGTTPAVVETRTPSGSYRYERVAAAPTDPDVLSAYEGRYTCPELDVGWSIGRKGAGLTVHRSRYPDTTLAPVFADGFRDDWEPIFGFPYSFLLVFDRATDGTVSGFRLSGARVRHLRFDKERL